MTTLNETFGQEITRVLGSRNKALPTRPHSSYTVEFLDDEGRQAGSMEAVVAYFKTLP
jgi:hypothetical protein